jgi:hypothetical protein
VPKFVEKLRSGADLVQGCRLPSGGGVIKPGAMPFLHRWVGNPLFSFLVRLWFDAPVHDVYCGLRAFRKDFQEKLFQRCTGMEFATEMVLKASMLRARIEEVPITLHPDGRKSRAPHLKTFRDGWRTLRFLLLCSPRWVFLVPGLLLLAFGSVAIFLGLPLLAGFLTRRIGVGMRGTRWYEQTFLPRISPLALYGLLFTIVVMFALQGQAITQDPLQVLRVALPLLIYFVVMWGLAFVVGQRSGFNYSRTAALAFTAAGNNFELAIAVSISLWGLESQQALAGVIGPLIEVPVLVSLVYVSLWLQRRFQGNPKRVDRSP